MNIDNGSMNSVVFLDIRKAFDTIDHQMLIKKLSQYGIQDDELNFFQSWHPGVKTGVDHYDLQTLDIYIFPSSIIVDSSIWVVDTSGAGGWLIVLGDV